MGLEWSGMPCVDMDDVVWSYGVGVVRVCVVRVVGVVRDGVSGLWV